ncbi:helicase HerA-like domain-containing protein [Agromyces marinus]|uniref:AAA+ ATPase domain-containing protein n=1 Tax=Agromyces marinus TaxID=1389020 RepID=A0ABM8GZN5_9MICO|nr:helicase HerA-like domain-containing protein [Agromyces marinus]UIP57879.1 hypothetical protein DSM26151_07450 [Agromyces marinus]BDZ53926.1 hypothetical protein GCM10025870_09990 [Agromyces marinus]
MSDDAVQQAREAAEAAAAAAAALQAQAAEAIRRAEEAAALARAAADAATDATATGAAESTPDAAVAPQASAARAQAADGPLDADEVERIRAGYAFEGAALEMGALVNGEALPGVPVRIPIAMTNRHGLVAGATGTGKTRTLQVLAEQLAASGVAVFAADIKGDLSGVATPGASSEKLLNRTDGIGQAWEAASFPTEFFSLGGVGRGVPIRATISGFGPLLLSKVLGLNETQESSLGLVFHYANKNGLALLDLDDLRTVLAYLVGDDGKAELAGLGGLSKATVGVILRELIAFADQGADAFFGEPEIDTDVFLRTADDGRGIISLLEVPGVADKPALYSTFLMWLLADLYAGLPEVGDLDRPKLVFFFDEAHLLFKDASDEFLSQVVQTVRLIRSKGVGVFFVTQTPKDVPADVLAQLGSRVQHQLRAFTPDDAKALRATVSTYPKSGYDLEETLTVLGTGEAIVTVMNEKGAPSPVAWTRLRAPQASMAPSADAAIDAAVAASPLMAEYGAPIDRESAHELLTARMADAAAKVEAEEAAAAKAEADAEYEKMQAKIRAEEEKSRRRAQAEYDRLMKQTSGSSRSRSGSRSGSRSPKSPLEQVLGSRTTQKVIGEVLTGLFGMAKRK